MSAPDVTVLGGGPAGATAALLLGSWGHDVELITKASGEHRLAVSLPPSCAKLFEAIGIADDIERANFIRSTGNTVWWGNEVARIEPFADGRRGWQLDVTSLSEVILERALAAGVNRSEFSPAPAGGRLVLDCTGRAGLLARLHNARRVNGPRTIALVGEWRRDHGWPVPDESHTLIESYVDGWMWSVPTAPGVRHIAAMVDPQRTDLAKGGTSKDVYLAEIGKTRTFKMMAAGASLGGGPWGWDATEYQANAYAGENWLLVGDAGSFIDPLSSAGVKKALASAWLAAITGHTCLVNPSMKAHALGFYDTREREIAAQLARQSRRMLAEAASGHQFWDDRSDDAIEDAAGQLEVQRAFEALKSRDAFSARIGAAVTIEPRPCVRGHEIVLEPHVIGADPAGVRYLRSINVVDVLELAPSSNTVPDLYEAYARHAGTAPLHDFLFVLATAVARGWLVAE